MDKKYWVPALEKSHEILNMIASQPHKLRLIDLSKQLGIHKSSLFSLLSTMEALHWVERNKSDTYALGSLIGTLGSQYFRGYDIIASFHQEAAMTMRSIGETIQLAKLEKNEVLYLAKEVAPSPVQLVSEPGMRLPAHATALGKAMLSVLQEVDVLELYRGVSLASLTPYTLTTLDSLLNNLRLVQSDGCSYDLQEAVLGFCCISAPVMNQSSQAVAAVSCSMPMHAWEQKRDRAKEEIVGLAQRLSVGLA
jgi:DNA-binding IclR family transcriptional regulator